MIVNEKYINSRLDTALEAHENCAGFGLRARKRLCDEGKVLVNGMKRKASYKVFAGQEITVLCESDEDNKNVKDNVYLIKEDENYLAYYKESLIPSVSYKGGSQISAETIILEEFPQAQLVNRLDTETSGILIAAKNESALNKWKEEQEKAEIVKKYYALVEGELLEELTIDFAIDLSKTKVKALPDYIAEDNRFTYVRPILHTNGNTFVECEIFKGVRHQIRCHLSAIGHPLVGDLQYDAKICDDNFLLHHYKIESPFFEAECLPKNEAWNDLVNFLKADKQI